MPVAGRAAIVGRPCAASSPFSPAFAFAAPANATVTAINEPPIIKGSSYTYWFHWQNVAGGNYSLCYYVSVNGGGDHARAGQDVHRARAGTPGC